MNTMIKIVLLSLTLIVIVSFCDAGFAAEEKNIYKLTTPSSGVVKIIKVEVGNKIKKGQVLIELDRRVFKAQLDETVALLKAMQLDFEEAERELGRTEELYERTIISDQELNLSKIAFAKSQGALKRSERMMIEAQYNYDYSQLLAPFNGRVKSINAFSGMLVNNQLKNTVLVTMEKIK